MLKLRDFVQGRPAARKLMAEVKSIESLVAGGSHPLHAAYSNAPELSVGVFGNSFTAAGVQNFTRVVVDAEQAYMPGWPPMSPVSMSFFTAWALLDLPVAATGETICSCAVEIGRAFGMSSDFTSTLEAMGESAMGIYQHLGWRDGLVGLRDILDDQVYRCIVPSGYRGAESELWYVRLLPPLTEAFPHGVAFTSPYILRGTIDRDWRAFGSSGAGAATVGVARRNGASPQGLVQSSIRTPIIGMNTFFLRITTPRTAPSNCTAFLSSPCGPMA